MSMFNDISYRELAAQVAPYVLGVLAIVAAIMVRRIPTSKFVPRAMPSLWKFERVGNVVARCNVNPEAWCFVKLPP